MASTNNKISMTKYKKEFELSLKQNEYEIKKHLQAIEKGYDDRISNIGKAKKICENNVIEITKLCNVLKQKYGAARCTETNCFNNKTEGKTQN